MCIIFCFYLQDSLPLFLATMHTTFVRYDWPFEVFPSSPLDHYLKAHISVKERNFKGIDVKIPEYIICSHDLYTNHENKVFLVIFGRGQIWFFAFNKNDTSLKLVVMFIWTSKGAENLKWKVPKALCNKNTFHMPSLFWYPFLWAMKMVLTKRPHKVLFSKHADCKRLILVFIE